MSELSLRELHATRLVVQRLAGPAAVDPVDAVRESLAVQSQDVPLAYDSLAQRTGGVAADARAALDRGAIVRTHVLRPTWHFVTRDDLRWLLTLTSPKVLSGLHHRHATLGLAEASRRTVLLDAVGAELAGGVGTRSSLGEALTARGLLERGPAFGSQLSHIMLIGELAGLWCSGPTASTGLSGHSYLLIDHSFPAGETSRDAAIAELVGRFFASHGPVSVKDLQRWTRLTIGEIRSGIAAVGPTVASLTVEGHELWFGVRELAERGPGTAVFEQARARAESGWLLSTFDEAVLSHNTLRMPIPDAAPHAGAGPRYSEAGGGPVIWNLTDVGVWKRVHTPTRFEVRLRLLPGLPDAAHAALRTEAHALARRAGADEATVVADDS